MKLKPVFVLAAVAGASTAANDMEITVDSFGRPVVIGAPTTLQEAVEAAPVDEYILSDINVINCKCGETA